MLLEKTVCLQGLKNRNLFGLISSPEMRRSSLIVATDMEGPLVLGDTVAEVISRKIPHGGIIYQAIYDWYTEKTLSRRRTKEDRHPEGRLPLWAQEGSDIVLALPLLLATNTDEKYINRVAMEYKRTPGSDELLRYLKDEGALVIGVTTSYDRPNKKIARNIGLDGLIGTPFPLDIAKDVLDKSGKFSKEIALVKSFLSDCSQIINGGNGENWLALKARIGSFYENELGISYDPEIIKKRGEPRTVIGTMIEEIRPVGDRTKAAVVMALRRSKLIKNEEGEVEGLLVTIGDGTNDAAMLSLPEARLSIALNGGPVESAKIGVITKDVKNIFVLIEMAKNNLKMDLDTLISEAQRVVGDGAIIHKGGSDVSEELIRKHKEMKKFLRGQTGTLVP